MNRSSLLPGLVLLAALGLTACDPEGGTASPRSNRSAAPATADAALTTTPPTVPVQRLVPPTTTRPSAPPTPRATTAAPVVRTTPRPVVTTAPKPVVTTKAKVVAASTCGAPSNPWGYNFCGRGSVINDPPDAFCDYFDCIPSFWESTNGYVMQCDDLMFSHSGGRQGSCSHHGGNYRALTG